MNRRLFFLSLSGLAGCTRPATRRLNILNWSDYVAPETLSDFEREFSVRVRYGTYESLEEMLARVMSGNSGWDVVFPTNYYIEPMTALDLLAPLDLSRLSDFAAPPWDPAKRWCVPYMTGATGILYQADLKPAVEAWDDLWHSRMHNRMTMLDDPAEVIGACLKKLGYSLNSGDPAQLQAAKREALRQKPMLRAYVNEIVRDQVVAGELLAAQVWRSTAMRAMEAAPGKLGFVYAKEGYPIYCDNIAVLRESKRYELAHQFIAYMQRPEVAMRVSQTKLESTVNPGARALLPAALRDNQTLYPPQDVIARGEWFQPLPGPTQRLRDFIWTEIKSS